MKKKILSLITAIMLFFGIFMIPSSASIVSCGNYDNVSRLNSFNVVKGMYYVDSTLFDKLYYDLGRNVETGKVSSYLYGMIDGDSHYLLENQYYENDLLKRIEYFFDEEMFYSIDFQDEFSYTILVDKEFNIGEYVNDYRKVFVKEDTPIYVAVNDEDLMEDYLSFAQAYSFSFLMGLTYTYNESYIDNDLHIVMSYKNKKTMDEILDGLSIIDATDTSYEIVDNTYDYETSSIGVYSFMLVVYDEAKNVTIQKVFIDVVDLVIPEIHQTKSIITKYDEVLTEEDILACFSVFDDSGVDITLDITDYLNSPNIVGDYESRITAVDKSNYHNVNTFDFIITVEDKIPPILAYSKVIHTDYHTRYTIDEIKALFTARDDYDGDVSNSIEVYDLDDYENNYMNLGAYTFLVSARDSIGNTVSVNFYVYVEDHTSPVLTIDQYVILTERGEPLKKEEIVALFQSLGYDIDGSNLSSEAFNLDALDGEYDLYIDLGDDGIEYDIVTTEKKNDISFDIPKVIEEENHLPLILSLSIGSTLLIAIGIMGIIVYKKRH